MVSHNHRRSRSKRSFSIFSLDTIRSFSRAGSRHGESKTKACLARSDHELASRISSKDNLRIGAESSLSHRCDPNNQPPPTPEPSVLNTAGEDANSKSPEI